MWTTRENNQLMLQNYGFLGFKLSFPLIPVSATAVKPCDITIALVGLSHHHVWQLVGTLLAPSNISLHIAY